MGSFFVKNWMKEDKIMQSKMFDNANVENVLKPSCNIYIKRMIYRSIACQVK